MCVCVCSVTLLTSPTAKQWPEVSLPELMSVHDVMEVPRTVFLLCMVCTEFRPALPLKVKQCAGNSGIRSGKLFLPVIKSKDWGEELVVSSRTTWSVHGQHNQMYLHFSPSQSAVERSRLPLATHNHVKSYTRGGVRKEDVLVKTWCHTNHYILILIFFVFVVEVCFP